MSCESYFCLTCGAMGVFVGLALAGVAVLITDALRARRTKK